VLFLYAYKLIQFELFWFTITTDAIQDSCTEVNGPNLELTFMSGIATDVHAQALPTLIIAKFAANAL